MFAILVPTPLVTLVFYNGKVNMLLSFHIKFVPSVYLSATLFYLGPSNAELFGSWQCTTTWTHFYAQLFGLVQRTII